MQINTYRSRSQQQQRSSSFIYQCLLPHSSWCPTGESDHTEQSGEASAQACKSHQSIARLLAPVIRVSLPQGKLYTPLHTDFLPYHR